MAPDRRARRSAKGNLFRTATGQTRGGQLWDVGRERDSRGLLRSRRPDLRRCARSAALARDLGTAGGCGRRHRCRPDAGRPNPAAVCRCLRRRKPDGDRGLQSVLLADRPDGSRSWPDAHRAALHRSVGRAEVGIGANGTPQRLGETARGGGFRICGTDAGWPDLRRLLPRRSCARQCVRALRLDCDF